MFVSIIIPTFNRAHLIGITLESLLQLNYSKELYEILVVDNNSTDTTEKVVKEWEIRSGGLIKYYFEPRQGSHFARNGIVKFAKGEWLYFTDDDMIADSNLLTSIISVFTNKKIGTATGRVIPKWEKEPPLWLKKYFVNGWLSLYDRDEEVYVSNDDFGVFSCHQIIRKELFLKAGGYNPDIVNGEWLGDNETGLNIKLKDMGYQFAFVKASVTQHMIPPGRMSQNYFNKRFANQGNCDSYTEYRKHKFTKLELKRNISTYRIQLVRKFLKYCVFFLLQRDKWHIHRAWIDYYQNRIKYDKKLMVDEEWMKMVLINDWINI